MAKRNASELNWVEIEVATPALKKRLDTVRDLQKKLADERKAFETQIIAKARKEGALEEGYTLVFGYRFGMVKVAKVSEAEVKAPKAPAKPKFTF
jgi:hypothetical protein